MRNYLILLLALFVVGGLKVQGQIPDFKYGLKISNQISHRKFDYVILDSSNRPITQLRLGTTDYLHAVPAFMWQTKHSNFNEVSLQELRLQRNDQLESDLLGASYVGRKVSYSNSIKFSHLHRFFKKKESDWLFLLGLEAAPYVEGYKYTPGASNYFPNSAVEVGLNGDLHPRVMWMPTKQLFFELGASARIFNLYYKRSLADVPTVEPWQRSTTNIGWNMFTGDLGMQLGVGIRL